MTYTTEAKVEGVTQFAITDSTEPTTTQVAVWIAEVDADIDARGLGSTAIESWQSEDIEKVDVVEKDTVEFIEYVQRYGWSDLKGVFWFPAFSPIISIQNLEKRTSDLDATEAWSALTEGPGSGSDFIIIKRKSKTNQYLGVAVYFYSDDKPNAGPLRIRAKYTYGWNINTNVLSEYATLQVGLKVLDALREANVPYGAGDYGIGDVRVGPEDMQRKRWNMIRRIKEIEDRYFPQQEFGGTAFI